MSKSTIENIENTLERHRVRLEVSLEKLRKALVRWQTYSAEYEGLKEELLELSQDASKECMIEAGYNFGGTVIDSAEVLNLLGEKAGIERRRDQVIQAINHRIVYITDNINKVEKQIEEGDDKLAGLLVMQSPDVLTEDGDPIIEIREDLDENGNIILSTTQPHGEGHVQSINLGDLEQFRKYVEDLAEKEKQPDLRPSIDPGAGGHEPEDPTVVEADNLVELTNTVIDTVPSVPVHEIRLDELPEMKSSRVEDVATQTTKYLTQPMEEEEDEVLHHRPTGGSVLNSTLCEEDFVLSIDEPPDAADLRRQMIDYNLHDIGAVVAELELESGDDDDEDEDDEDEGEGEGDDEDDDDNEEEDKYGRTTSRIITTDLEREMQALQARIRERQESEKTQNQELGTALELPNAAQVRISPEKQEAPPPSKKKGVTFSEKLEVAVIPPKPKPEPQGYILPPSPTLDSDDAIPFLVDLLAREQVKEDMRNAGWDQPGSTAQSNGWGAKIKHDTEAQTKKVSKFKASRIARTTEDQDPEAKARTSADRAPAVKPAIIERQSVSSPSPAPPQATVHGKPEKSSLFETSKIKNTEPSTAIFNNPSVGIHKNTVAATSLLEDTMGLVQDEADKPLHPLLAPKIIEKPPTVRSSPGDIPLAPSELDHTIHRQEVAVEYFKVRNRMIQKEGGFLPREEEEMFVPVDDGKKKVSRFKAARISMGKVSPQ